MLSTTLSACSKGKYTEMCYSIEIEAIDRNDIQAIEPTVETLKKRIQEMAHRGKYTFEHTSNTIFRTTFKTTMTPEMVETALTSTGEAGFYEIVPPTDLLGISILLSEAAKTDPEKYAGLQKYQKYLYRDNAFQPGLFVYIPEEELEDVLKTAQAAVSDGLLPHETHPIRSTWQRGHFDRSYYNIYLVKLTPDGNPVLSEDDIRRAEYAISRKQPFPSINIEFSTEAAAIWLDLTRKNTGKPIAIVMDGEVVSAPTVYQEIEGGKASIAGDMDSETLAAWAVILNSGSLKLPVTVQRQE